MDESPTMRRYRGLIELFELNKGIMRQKLRRRFPAESEAVIERRLALWISKHDEWSAETLPPLVDPP